LLPGAQSTEVAPDGGLGLAAGRIRTLVLLAGIVGVSYSAPAESQQSGAIDSTGILLTASSAANVPTWTIDLPDQLEIGVGDGDAPYSFHRILSAYRLRDGRIIVADGDSKELRYFSPSGRHIRTVGRPGRGPGEFATLTAVVRLPGDSLLVHDLHNMRLTTITADGKIAAETRPAGQPGFVSGRLLGRLAGGELVFLTRSSPFRLYSGVWRDTVFISTAHIGTEKLDTVLRIPSTEYLSVSSSGPGGGRTVSRMHPFSYTAAVTLWNGEIVAGTGESWELRVFDPKGRLRQILRRSDHEMIPLEGSPLDEYLDEVKAAGYSLVAAQESMRGLPTPRSVPAFSKALVDDVGCLWVQDFAPSGLIGRFRPHGWTILRQDGAVIARATTPPGFEPYHIGEGFVLGRFTDELQVEHIRLYGLRRTNSTSTGVHQGCKPR
jgi:hypothetical protein